MPHGLSARTQAPDGTCAGLTRSLAAAGAESVTPSGRWFNALSGSLHIPPSASVAATVFAPRRALLFLSPQVRRPNRNLASMRARELGQRSREQRERACDSSLYRVRRRQPKSADMPLQSVRPAPDWRRRDARPLAMAVKWKMASKVSPIKPPAT